MADGNDGNDGVVVVVVVVVVGLEHRHIKLDFPVCFRYIYVYKWVLS